VRVGQHASVKESVPLSSRGKNGNLRSMNLSEILRGSRVWADQGATDTAGVRLSWDVRYQVDNKRKGWVTCIIQIEKG